MFRFFCQFAPASNSIQIVCFFILLLAGSKLATKPKHQGVKWLFLKVWDKTVKVTKPQEAKEKFTLTLNYVFYNIKSKSM
ncbi:hypothetical protein Hanom_Chr05g00453311 [Helianthus anomalus]